MFVALSVTRAPEADRRCEDKAQSRRKPRHQRIRHRGHHRGDQRCCRSAGIATFPKLRVTKAGGYTIQAVGSLSGNPTSAVVSNLFNVKGQ